MVQIIPAILSTSLEDYKRDLDKINNSSLLQDGWLHIDFADGIFVHNKTIDPKKTIDYPTNLKKEAHLMVASPLEWIDKAIDSGFERIIFHLETDNPEDSIEAIRQKNKEVGIALKHETPLERIIPFKDKVNLVLLMTVAPGFQGQPFIPQSLEKIKKLKILGWDVSIGVDGAVSDSDIIDIIKAGAQHLVVGSYLLKGEIDENLERLREAQGQDTKY